MTTQERVVRYDADGAERTMRKRDYWADMSGQFALGIMGNIVGQLTYFYTDKVGMAVGAVGVVMAAAKVVDAFTDVIVGNVIDHSRGGNKKYYQWMLRLALPAAAIVVLIFSVPAHAATGAQMAYALVTNLLLTAVIYTMIATPFSAVMVVRTSSQSERASMGVFRAVGNYGAGMLMSILTIPVTNMLGGTQSAWIRYGVVLAAVVLLLFLICVRNGVRAPFVTRSRTTESDDTVPSEAAEAPVEEEPVPFREALGMLLRNRYWVIVLLFNLITSVVFACSAAAGPYYAKWIFGNDNLVGVFGTVGMLSTIVGFTAAKPIIAKLGVSRTVLMGCMGSALASLVIVFQPSNLIVFVTMSFIGSFIQIPLMCLYGVLLAMAVDYNEWKYDKKIVAISSGAIGFGSKVGSGVGALLLSGFLALGSYDPTLAVASDSMRTSILAFALGVPICLNIILFLIFTRFDLEEKLPTLRAEVQARRQAAVDGQDEGEPDAHH